MSHPTIPENTQAQNRVFLASAPESYSGPLSLALDKELARLEAYLVATALRQAHGNRTHAARLLGIKRTRLVEFLKRSATIYGSTVPDERADNQ